jgi:sulfate permease, SulP family
LAAKSVLLLRTYTFKQFFSDLIAGITVGLVALPLAMAFGIASGVPPQSGLYCAIVAGFFISALGGSKTQIGGPTGAFVVVVFGIVAKYGIESLYMCTLLAGIILVMLGITRLGTAVKFIPRPVVVGFTNGIAVIIASTQIKDFFGLMIDKVPGDFLARIEILCKNMHTLQSSGTALGCLALAIIIACNRFVKRVPGYIVALDGGLHACAHGKKAYSPAESRRCAVCQETGTRADCGKLVFPFVPTMLFLFPDLRRK